MNVRTAVVTEPVGTGSDPSPICVLHVFSDRLFRPATVQVGATHLPCGERRMPNRLLAELLLAAAVWSLREQGHVELALVDGRATAVVELVADATVNAERDLERAILGVLRAASAATGRRTHTLEDVVWELVRRHGANAPLSLSMAEAARHPGLRRQADAEHRFHAACAALERFCRDDRPLYDAVVTDHRLALARWVG